MTTQSGLCRTQTEVFPASYYHIRTSKMATSRCVTSPENPSVVFCVSTLPSITSPSFQCIFPQSGRGNLTRSSPANQQGGLPLADSPGASPWREVGMTTTLIETDRSLLHIMGLWRDRQWSIGWRGVMEAFCEGRRIVISDGVSLCWGHCSPVFAPFLPHSYGS